MQADQNRQLLYNLADLLLQNRGELARVNTLDVQTSLATNRDNVDRAIATLKGYANGEFKILPGKKGGLAAYSCYGDPSFGLFGMTLAPALLAAGANIKILIGWPGLLKQYGAFVEQMLTKSGLLPNLEFTFNSKEFFAKTLADETIGHCVVFGDVWIFKYLEAFRNKKSLTYYGPGNNAAIILPGADLEKAVDKILESAFILSGQAAVCINRCIVDNRVDRNKLEAIFNKKLKNIKSGDAQSAFVTPIVVSQLTDQLEQRIKELESEHFTLTNYKITKTEVGILIEPALAWLNSSKNKLWSDYHFAPVLSILFSDYEQIASFVSNTDYGIYTSIWGDHLSKTEPLINKIENDHIFVLKNQSILDIITTDQGYVGPWGGYKKSGFCMSAQNNWQVQEGAFLLFDVINHEIS